MATGKRAGARRAAPARAVGPGTAPRPPKSTASAPAIDPRVLGYSAGITLCVVAWGYLVYAAIDFGVAGRSGSSGGWGMLALASLGAMACLFVGLMLASRLAAALGLAKGAAPVADATTSHEEDEPPAQAPTASPTTAATPPAKPARQPGGRRIARR